MNLDEIFTYAVNNSVMISQWLIVCVAATSLLYLGIRLFAKDKLASEDVVIVERSSSADGVASSLVSPISPSIDEIMAQPGMASTGPTTFGGGLGAGPNPGLNRTSNVDSSGLQQELSKKDIEVRQLREEIEKVKSSSLDSTALRAKIDELQGKLAEYEILEDDIADLSKFKEENARLRAEIEALRTGASLNESFGIPADEEVGSMAEPESAEDALPGLTATSGVEADDGEPISKDELVAQFEATLETESKSEKSIDDVAPIKSEDDDGGPDFVAEFEVAVQQQKTAKVDNDDNGDNGESEGASDMPTGDDILAEFAESLGQDESDSVGPAGAVGLNTDKMLEEMVGLSESGDDDSGSALEEEMDTEKMASEASKLLSGEE